MSEDIRARILLAVKTTTRKGEIVIKASRYRTQERNKQDALNRLQELIRCAAAIPKKRKKTRPTFTSIQQRLAKKKLHGKIKSLRRSNPNSE